MEAIYDLHEKPELKAHFKKSMTEYVKAVKEDVGDEELYIIVFGTDVKTMCDTYTCLPHSNSEEGFERCRESDFWKKSIEEDGDDEEEVYWTLRINQHEWDYQLDPTQTNKIFKPVRDFLTDYFKEVEAGFEDEDVLKFMK